MTLYIHFCLQSEEMEILFFPVGCAQRDCVRSKVSTEKLGSYTRILSPKQNKRLLFFQLQCLLDRKIDLNVNERFYIKM